jgi:hypothetical protein
MKKTPNINTVVEDVFKEIEQRVDYDLKKGGDGCTERVINDSKYSVDDVLSGSPLYYNGKSYNKNCI